MLPHEKRGKNHWSRVAEYNLLVWQMCDLVMDIWHNSPVLLCVLWVVWMDRSSQDINTDKSSRMHTSDSPHLFTLYNVSLVLYIFSNPMMKQNRVSIKRVFTMSVNCVQYWSIYNTLYQCWNMNKERQTTLYLVYIVATHHNTPKHNTTACTTQHNTIYNTTTCTT